MFTLESVFDGFEFCFARCQLCAWYAYTYVLTDFLKIGWFFGTGFVFSWYDIQDNHDRLSNDCSVYFVPCCQLRQNLERFFFFDVTLARPFKRYRRSTRPTCRDRLARSMPAAAGGSGASRSSRPSSEYGGSFTSTSRGVRYIRTAGDGAIVAERVAPSSLAGFD